MAIHVNDGKGLGSPALNNELIKISVKGGTGASKKGTQGAKLAETQAKAILNAPGATAAQKKQANDILHPKKPGFFASALGSIADSKLGKGAMGVLDAFDTARAVVVSGVSETNDLLTDAFNLKGHEYVDASWGDFVKQARDNIGMGQVFREKAAAAAAAGDNKIFGITTFKNPELLKNAPKGGAAFKEFLKSEEIHKGLNYTGGGKALGIGTGLAGDIGLDPLTYLSMGGEKIAGMSADAVTSEAMKYGEHAIAQKAATKGKWALKAADLEKIGLAGEGGIHFKVPGTGLIGRHTLNREMLATGEGALRTGAIKGTEDAMRLTPVGMYQSGRAAVRTSLAERGLSAAFGGKFNTLKDVMYKGTPKEFADAFNVLKADQASIGWEKTFADGIERQYTTLEHRLNQAKIDMTDVYHALGDPENVTDSAKRILATEGGPELLADARKFAQEVLPISVNEHAGQTIIKNTREGWQPSLRPKETFDHLIMTGSEKTGGLGGVPLNKSGAEIEAQLVADGEFMGEKLFTPAESVGKFGNDTPLTPREQAFHILQQKMALHGENNVKAMFEEDFSKAMPASIRNMAHRVYTSRMEVELLDRGVAGKLVNAVEDPKLAVAVGVVQQTKMKLADLRMQARLTALESTDAKTLTQQLLQRANVMKNIGASRDARRAAALAKMTTEARAAAGVEYKAAEAAIEAAGRLSGHLVELRAGSSEILAGIKDLAYLDTPEFAAAGARVAAAAEGMDISQGTMGRLLRERETLLGKMNAAAADAEQRVSKAGLRAAERDALPTRIKDLEDTIADLTAAHAKMIQGTSPNLKAELDGLTQRAAEVEKGKRLAGELNALEDVATHSPGYKLDERLWIQSQLKNNFWTDLSREPSAKVMVKMDLVADQIRKMREPLEAQVKMLDEIASTESALVLNAEKLSTLTARAMELQKPDAAEELFNLQRSMPDVQGAALVNPKHPEGLWYLGDVGRVDVSTPGGWRTGAAATENGLGIRLTQTATEHGTGEVVAKVTNPKIYGVDDVLDMAYEHRQLAAYGTTAPNSVRMMRNDMLKDAWANGTLKSELMPSHQREWKAVEAQLAQGHTFEESMRSAFGGALGLSKRNYDIQGIGDGEWLTSQMADRLLGESGTLSGELKSKVAGDFRQRLAQTHDAIILPGAPGEWQTIALRPEVLHTTGGQMVDGIITLQSAADALHAQLFKHADEARAAADAVGADLNVALGEYKNLERTFIDSNLAKAEVELELRRGAVGQLGEKLHFEYELRAEVDRLATAATDHRLKAEGFRQQVLQAADAMGKAKAHESAQIEDVLARHAEAKAAAHSLEADWRRTLRKHGKLTTKLDRAEGRVANIAAHNLSTTGSADLKLVRDSLAYGMRELAQDVYAPNYIVQAISDMSRVIGAPAGEAGLLRAFDKVTNLWKAQAITRPGFHIRNYMGGIVNNWIANVEATAYSGFQSRFAVYQAAVQGAEESALKRAAGKVPLVGKGLAADATAAVGHEAAIAEVAKKFGAEDALKIRQIVEGGIVTGGQSAETKIIGGAHAGNLNPFSQNFKLYKANSASMAKVENHLRGAMAWDRLTKGVTMDGVMGDVARYHFDYDDLSKLERNGIRRVVPFYTWTRKNFPLQIEMALENPKHMTRFLNAKRDIEGVSPDEDVYPDWFNGEMSVRLPFGGASGSAAYLFPDAPFKDIGGAVSPSKALESVNPLFKTPIEMKMGVKAFGNIPFKDGYQPVPSIWEKFGVPEVMSAFGRASKDSDGNWVMRDKDLYLVENWMPMLANARRLAPSEEKFTDRVTYSWASFMLGQTARTNTATDQNSEMVRRSEQLKTLKKDLQTKGYVAEATPATKKRTIKVGG